MAIRSSEDMHNAFIWLRDEKLRTVQWAGKSAKHITPDGAGNYRLTPRKSFQLWSELWRGHSTSWSLFDTEIASMLAKRVFAPEKTNKLRLCHRYLLV